MAKWDDRHNSLSRLKGTKPAAGKFGVNFVKQHKRYLANNIEIRPVGIAGDIVIAFIIDDQNIMLAIAASPSLAMRNCQHRFH